MMTKCGVKLTVILNLLTVMMQQLTEKYKMEKNVYQKKQQKQLKYLETESV